MTDPWAVVPSEFLTYDEEEPAADDVRERVAAWLRRRLGIELRSLTRRAGGGGGHKSTIYFADTDGGPLVVRAPMPGTGWSAPLLGCPPYHCVAGAYAIARLTLLGQPVPEVLAIERDQSVLGGPFAASRRVAGVHMQDWAADWTTWPYPEEQWGRFLAACHGVMPVRGAGPMDDDGVGCCASWAECVSRLLSARARQFADLLPTGFGARTESLVQRMRPLLGSRPVRLLHLESAGFCNVILDPQRHIIVGVLDFEDVTAGDPLYELVVMGWYLGRRGICDHGGRPPFGWRRFYRGYGRVDWRHPLVPVYTLAVLLEKLWRRDEAAIQRARRAMRVLCTLERDQQ